MSNGLWLRHAKKRAYSASKNEKEEKGPAPYSIREKSARNKRGRGGIEMSGKMAIVSWRKGGRLRWLLERGRGSSGGKTETSSSRCAQGGKRNLRVYKRIRRKSFVSNCRAKERRRSSTEPARRGRSRVRHLLMDEKRVGVNLPENKIWAMIPERRFFAGRSFRRRKKDAVSSSCKEGRFPQAVIKWRSGSCASGENRSAGNKGKH